MHGDARKTKVDGRVTGPGTAGRLARCGSVADRAGGRCGRGLRFIA
jgi:hypothetical protein